MVTSRKSPDEKDEIATIAVYVTVIVSIFTAGIIFDDFRLVHLITDLLSAGFSLPSTATARPGIRSERRVASDSRTDRTQR